MKRTTVRLDEALLIEAKQAAATSGRTLTALIEDAVRETLARRRQTEHRKPVRLPTVGGHGILPGVDLDGSASLLELMEGADAPR